jgi:hypothetical protein
MWDKKMVIRLYYLHVPQTRSSAVGHQMIFDMNLLGQGNDDYVWETTIWLSHDPRDLLST